MLKHVAIQIDPLDQLTYHDDSSYLLGLEAIRRGTELFTYQPQNLTFKDNQLWAWGHVTRFSEDLNQPYEIRETKSVCLNQYDIVFIRQDPPINMEYISASYLLDQIHPETWVMNHPKAVRNMTEKMAILDFPEFIAPTIVTNRLEEVQAFLDQHGEIIIKPLYERGGRGIFHITKEDTNLSSLIHQIASFRQEPFMVQKFLPEIKQTGDKRIMIIDGEPIAALGRFPSDTDFRANLHSGGTCGQADINEDDLRICEALKPVFQENDIIFAGIDVIGGYLTEINITSPTCIPEVNQNTGLKIEKMIFDAIETKRKK